MLHLDNSTLFYWYNGAADMRKSFDALSGIVQQHMQRNVLHGGVFIFINKKRNQIKLLTWERDGLAIYYKRLEKGVYELPTASTNDNCVCIDVLHLQLILQGIVINSVKRKKRFSLPKLKNS